MKEEIHVVFMSYNAKKTQRERPYTHTQILIYTQVLAGCSPFHSHSLSALHPGMAPHVPPWKLWNKTWPQPLHTPCALWTAPRHP